MPIIPKPDKSRKVARQCKIDERLATLLDRYCTFLEADPDYVFDRLLRAVCCKDREFLKWQAEQALEPVRLPDTHEELIALPAARRKASEHGNA